MTALTITTCPHCGAEAEAFHHTRWDSLESHSGAGPEFCPGCGKPLDPERAAWKDAASSGELFEETRHLLGAIATGSVTVVILCFTASFLARGNELHGLIALVLLAGFAIILAWRRAARPEKETPLVAFELLPHTGSTSAPPLWDTTIKEGIRANVPQRREKQHSADASAPSPPQDKTFSPDEIARRIAVAWLEPEVDHPIRRQVRVLSERTTQWPAMRPAEADRRLGTPAAIGSDGTRAYVTVRRDGRGILSLLQRNGIERVLRLEVKWRTRRA
ncbi:DUF2321 domain-containing protein [Luteolibacter arcticus]|uniref:DUF2321 domain-containing protein n=1 Tax=Luteolibacter arcticus TaxID=1581411 RepID=A0ABT3GPW3_9BACT|nr:DUF2321 domain-containing protein [Luteolibacter arcticus]MCW1925572.1 DUF2321 domain-containing protein [Luteolibacter arcticus]